MKLPDFFKFQPLIDLKIRMGIPPDMKGGLTVEVAPPRLSEVELERLLSTDGLDISPDELTVLDDGTLAYKDSRVLLYIRDVTVYGDQMTEPRFHVSNCSTLSQMRSKRRFNSRYVVATRTDGRFRLNYIRRNNETKSDVYQLSVCQNCLDNLGFNGFTRVWKKSRKLDAVRGFSLDAFFQKYPKSLHVEKPKYNEDNAPLNNYTDDFSEIGAAAKQRVQFRCERCGIRLSAASTRKYLHVHHKNADKSDNSEVNLEVLCLYCHAHEPAHNHMKSSQNYLEFCRLRKQMGW
jgi:hypothetical protein